MKFLRLVVYAAATVAFAIAALGSWMRIEHAGQLMCTDWPLCRGELLPPLQGRIAIEWAHRALSSLEGILIFTIFVLAWPRRSATAGLRPLLLALGGCFAAAVALGGATVVTTRSPLSITAHWATAIVLLATLFALAIVLRVDEPVARGEATAIKLGAAAALAFAAMSIGSFISSSYAGIPCSTFPGCNQTLTGHTAPQVAQMLHRLVAGSFVVVAVLATIAARQHSSRSAKRLATAGVALAFVQACLGVATVRLADTLWIREAHATVAGLTFVIFAGAAVFAALQPRAQAPARQRLAPAVAS